MQTFLLLATLARVPAPAGGPAVEASTVEAPAEVRVEAEEAVLPWSEGRRRWFAGAQIDVGYLYLRPRFQVGWGQPHHNWFGIDANPIVDTKGLGGYLGLRFEWPNVDLRAGGRYHYSFARSYLVRQPSYDQYATLERTEDHAQYLSLEAQLTSELPWGPGKLRFEGTGTYVAGVPDGMRVFEETRKLVVEPPWIFSGELGYLFAIGASKRFHIGPVAEVLYNPGREALMVRGGAKATLKLWPHWQARATFQPPIYGPDSLGLAGGDSFQLGIRYRWATD